MSCGLDKGVQKKEYAVIQFKRHWAGGPTEQESDLQSTSPIRAWQVKAA